MSEQTTDEKLAALTEEIHKRFYTDGYEATLDEAAVLLGGATMLASLFKAERDRLSMELTMLRQAIDADRTFQLDALRKLGAERDELRATVDAARKYRDVMFGERIQNSGWLDRADKAASDLFARLDALAPTREVTDG